MGGAQAFKIIIIIVKNNKNLRIRLCSSRDLSPLLYEPDI